MARLLEAQPENSTRGLYLAQCASCHGDDLRGEPPQFPSLNDLAGKRTAAEIGAVIRQGGGRMPAFAALRPADITALTEYLLQGHGKELESSASTDRGPRFRFTGYHTFVDPDGYPAIAPPWGTLNAINLHTGEYAWRIPLGEYREPAAKDPGSENSGGPIATAGGLVFIPATKYHRKSRAFDKATGELRWQTALP